MKRLLAPSRLAPLALGISLVAGGSIPAAGAARPHDGPVVVQYWENLS